MEDQETPQSSQEAGWRMRRHASGRSCLALQIARPVATVHRGLPYQSDLCKSFPPRFSAANLTGPERQRFFRAFLRYELLCKWCTSDSLGDSSWYYYLSSLWRYKGRIFRVVEAEAIACVRFYVESLHKAITIQCELHEESQCVIDHLCSDLSYFGLDLAAALLQAATAGKQGREHVRMCWHGLYERRPQDDYSLAFKDCILGYDPLREKDEHYTEGPGMYRMLYPIALSSAMQRYLYRRKAWAFFDDIRLHPARLQHVCFTDADWGDVEKLHSLHDRPIDEYPHSPETQMGYPAPPFWQGNRFVGLDPFWQ
ncbi:hypothetical protein SAMD00023353_4100500 [Rosellinia necatrix]|uniref:Uncharacterized protein n=1 Tax=Rosellinia necatrix TaxID=77044 RepID=A0A1W2TNB1_ROSNE|nr:hypothetical protein SAMD00023353_4100500 [Rosellinia necatrix]